MLQNTDNLLEKEKWQIICTNNRCVVLDIEATHDRDDDPIIQTNRLKITQWRYHEGRFAFKILYYEDDETLGRTTLVETYDLRFDSSGNTARGNWTSACGHDQNDSTHEHGTIKLKRWNQMDSTDSKNKPLTPSQRNARIASIRVELQSLERKIKDQSETVVVQEKNCTVHPSGSAGMALDASKDLLQFYEGKKAKLELELSTLESEQ